MSNLSIKISENIKSLRRKANLKQYELANKIGVNNITMSKIEKGRSSLKLATIEKIAEVLGVGLEQVIFGEDTVILNNNVIEQLRSK